MRGCGARPRSRSTISPSHRGRPAAAGEARERLDRVRRPHWPRRGGGRPDTGLNGSRRTARPGPRGGAGEGRHTGGRAPSGVREPAKGEHPCKRGSPCPCASPWARPGSRRGASPWRSGGPWRCANPWRSGGPWRCGPF